MRVCQQERLVCYIARSALPASCERPQISEAACVGFLWASRRWASTRVLHLRLQYSDTSKGEWMSSMTHAATSLSRLEKLLLDCSHKLEGDWARVQSTPLLSNVLRHAQMLRVLQVHCHTFSFPAPLQSLKHLQLSLGGGEADVDLSTLALAPNLETVRVRYLRLASEVRTIPEHLDLRPLSNLTALCLEFFAPLQLSLPQECSLSVVMDELEMAGAGVWESVRSHIRCFTIQDSGRLLSEGLRDLPPVVLREPPLMQVCLNFLSFGTVESPWQLSKALAQATSLMLESQHGMYLKVPDEASWQHLVITAPQQLQWEWLSARRGIVPWRPQQFPFDYVSIEFGSLLGTGVLELFRECPPDDTQHQSERGGTALICMTRPGSEHVWCHQRECCCGTCNDCLRKYWSESIWPYR